MNRSWNSNFNLGRRQALRGIDNFDRCSRTRRLIGRRQNLITSAFLWSLHLRRHSLLVVVIMGNLRVMQLRLRDLGIARAELAVALGNVWGTWPKNQTPKPEARGQDLQCGDLQGQQHCSACAEELQHGPASPELALLTGNRQPGIRNRALQLTLPG